MKPFALIAIPCRSLPDPCLSLTIFRLNFANFADVAVFGEGRLFYILKFAQIKYLVTELLSVENKIGNFTQLLHTKLQSCREQSLNLKVISNIQI